MNVVERQVRRFDRVQQRRPEYEVDVAVSPAADEDPLTRADGEAEAARGEVPAPEAPAASTHRS